MSDTHEMEKQLVVLETKLTILIDRFDAVEAQVQEISALAHRWRGAFFVILGLGGIAGFLAEKLIPSVFR